MAEIPEIKRRGRRSTAGPTVADVARAAGVSLMTVSRVVNGGANVLPAKRERVEKAVAELGYVPNPAARSLAGGRQCRIGLLYSNPSAAYLSEFLVGSLAGAAGSDAQLVVEQWDGAECVDALIQRLSSHRIDAVLLPPPLCEHPEILGALEACGLPIAQVATGRPAPYAHAVTVGDADAAYTMTRRLLDMGHVRIGFIVGNPDQSASALRREGYERALREAGIAIDPGLIAQGDFTYRSGLDAANRLLDCTPRPTAIFASNDDMAAAVLSIAHRRHLDVPRDLSVCGYDDTAMATNIWPELTTIRQPVADMACEATAILADAVRRRQRGMTLAPRHRQLDFSLIERASSARPAG